MPSYTDLESHIARLRHELGSARRGQARWYEANRKLENAVRKANGYTDLADRSSALTIIARRVPIHPRKKWGWRS